MKRYRGVYIESLENRRLLSTVVLTNTQTAAVGSFPKSVVTADVNRDGSLDVIASNLNDSTISVMLNNDAGGLLPQQTYATGEGPQAIVAADLNGDGIPDIITANHGTNVGTVSVLLGNGDGTFQGEQDYAATSDAIGLAVADVNNDGNLDVIAVSPNDGIVILLGEGNGTLRPETVVTTQTGPFSVATGDFNHDGNVDIVTTNRGRNSISVLLGKGNGTFGSPTAYDAGVSPEQISVGDFNLDGRPDIAVNNFGGDSVSVLLGKGDGTFAPLKSYPAGENPNSITSADMNDDGVPDLIAADFNSNTVSVLLNNGNGTFAAPLSFATGKAPYDVAAADLDGDGMPALISANYESNNVSVLTNQPLLRAPKLVTPNAKATGVSIFPTLSWTAVTRASNYRVVVTTNANSLPTDPTVTGIADAAIDETTHASPFEPDISLQPGTTYFWKVQALNGDQVGNWSKAASFTTAPDVAPAIHKIANATDGLGVPFRSSGFFTDPDEIDRWTGTVNWGDGSRSQALSITESLHFGLVHAFKKAGTYTATVTINDRYGKSATRQFKVTVVAPT